MWLGVIRYLIEVECSLGQLKSANLKEKKYTIYATELELDRVTDVPKSVLRLFGG